MNWFSFVVMKYNIYQTGVALCIAYTTYMSIYINMVSFSYHKYFDIFALW